MGLALVSDAIGLAPVCLRDAPLYTDLVAVHKDEMDVLFGAYSRASVEEKRLLEVAAAAGGGGGSGGGGGGDSVVTTQQQQHHP